MQVYFEKDPKLRIQKVAFSSCLYILIKLKHFFYYYNFFCQIMALVIFCPISVPFLDTVFVDYQ